MSDVMVTGRMPEEKKSRATRILHRRASAPRRPSTCFSTESSTKETPTSLDKPSRDDLGAWRQAADFVDAMPKNELWGSTI